MAIGSICFALFALRIRYEATYDTFHEGAECIYLAGNKFESQGDGFSYYSSGLLADYVMKNCLEMEKACHLSKGDIKPIEYEKDIYHTGQLEADSNLISVFNIIVIDGDNRLQLGDKQIAIIDKITKQIFGKESPIGKSLLFPNRGNIEMMIAVVVKSWEGHSLYLFDILLLYKDEDPNRDRQQHNTLLCMYPNSDVKALEKRLTECEIQQDSHKQLIATLIVLLSTLWNTHPRKDASVKLNHARLFTCIGALVTICGLCNYLTMSVTRIRIRKRELALGKADGSSNTSSLLLLPSELILLLLILSGIEITLMELILPIFILLS